MQLEFPFTGSVIPDQYGDHIPTAEKLHGLNQVSLPFKVTEIPANAVVLAGTLVDYDTVSFVGFPWLHWVFTDVPVHGQTVTFATDASRRATFAQGLNSLHSPFQRLRQPDWPLLKERKNLESHYAGPRPVSGAHMYRLTVYALSQPTNLSNGFLQGDLMALLDERLLAVAGRNLTYAKA